MLEPVDAADMISCLPVGSEVAKLESLGGGHWLVKQHPWSLIVKEDNSHSQLSFPLGWGLVEQEISDRSLLL